MSATDLLSRLERVRRTGLETWMARCPAHEDKRPSLSIRETGDGKVLLHCWAGCTVHEIVAAVGIRLEDLFPPRPSHRGKPERRPFPAADALRAVDREALIAAVAASRLSAGYELSSDDRDRLLLASQRIYAAVRESCHAR